MFKKRARPQSSFRREKVEDEAKDAKSGDDEVELDELLQLRKLRRNKQGIDLERFNRGDAKLEKGESSTYGLKRSNRDEFEDEMQRMMRMVKSNNFTQQTNVLDADKHMLDYIEKEMAKRRGGITEAGPIDETFDPHEELYRMANKYKWDKEKVEESSATNSMGMLTSIPEVDLGMDNRLRNIEATERAKREMEARKETRVERRPEDEDFAAARYHRPTLRIASDIYAVDEEQREAAGVQPPARQKEGAATDAAVYDRFKKRMKR